MESLQQEIPICYFWLADLYAQCGDMQRCKLCYLKAYAHTENASCLYELALAYKKSGKHFHLIQAKKYCKKAIEAYKDKVGSRCEEVKRAYDLLTKICIMSGDLIEAFSIIEEHPSDNKVLIMGLQALLKRDLTS